MAASNHRAEGTVIGGGFAGIVTAIELLEAGGAVATVNRADEAVFGSQARACRRAAESSRTRPSSLRWQRLRVP